jgi:DNA (cytosine-5)-methyltransferase 1
MVGQRSSDSVIALFSGAGGLSLGFAQAGMCPKISVDIDADACSTYQANLESNVFNVDISQNVLEFSKAISSQVNVFALVGGPPCQGFSSAGMKDGRDKRNKLIFALPSG